MDPITPTAVSLAELIVALIAAVGVGNFILIVFVLMLFINMPTLISKLKDTITSSASKKKMLEYQQTFIEGVNSINLLTQQVNSSAVGIDQLKGEIKALVAIVDGLHASIIKEGEERRQENIILSDTLERQVRAIEAIDKMMRNVMSESDTLRMTAFIIGITSSLKADILSKISAIIAGPDKSDSGLTDLNLRSDIETAWSDIKTEIDRFKTPVKIRLFLDEREKHLWGQTGLFTKITHIASSSELSQEKKISTISKQLDNGLRDLQDELVKYLNRVKAATRGE